MTQPARPARLPSPALVVGLIALLFASGCGPGSGQGLDGDGNLPSPSSVGAGGGTGASGNPDATLAWVSSNVFGGVCSQCHTGASAPLGLDWSSLGHVCANVLRQSAEHPELKEIDPGNPAGSYVIWKVEGAGPNGEAIVGGRMPLNNPALPAATIQNMRDWIADGVIGC